MARWQYQSRVCMRVKKDAKAGGWVVFKRYSYYTSNQAKFKLFEYDVDLLSCASDSTPFDPHSKHLLPHGQKTFDSCVDSAQECIKVANR